jgi:hypothetical protein
LASEAAGFFSKRKEAMFFLIPRKLPLLQRVGYNYGIVQRFSQQPGWFCKMKEKK